ncbi:hypothetical protein [Endozoicomonas montiporae]|uniref:hypothetical protein n=1 Tax=Endozoicomonas montiporae TaxID=1027273 RepID=UPI0011A4508C|nr:hypothetical protein [Endozoicomonas montiporae]
MDDELYNFPLNVFVAGTGETCGGGLRLFNGMSPQNQQGFLRYSNDSSSSFRNLIRMQLQSWFDRSGLKQKEFKKLIVYSANNQIGANIQIDGEVFRMNYPIQAEWKPELFRFMSARTPQEANKDQERLMEQ